jgi:hypothetical protein
MLRCALGNRKTAKIKCSGGGEFWATPEKFWSLVGEGLVEVDGKTAKPLTGLFTGKREKFLVKARGVILDSASPNHKSEVLDSYSRLVPHRSQQRAPDLKELQSKHQRPTI